MDALEEGTDLERRDNLSYSIRDVQRQAAAC